MIIKIKEVYHSAWQKYGWEKGVWGVGLAKDKVDLAAQMKTNLEVWIKKDKYKVNPEEVREYAIYTAKGKKLYEIPKTILDKI